MQNNFPNVSPKQSFPALESEVLAYWKANDTFKKSIESRPEENPYRFYDGPPFITGTPHYGSLLSSVVKDAVGRYWTMRGRRVERVWGWDCHGLPIEEKVQKKLGLTSNKDIEEKGIKEFIDGCYEYTQTTSAEWDWYIDKIGRWVDMDRAYRTMDQDYMESVMWVFKQLWDKGLIYKGKRVSLYSWKLSTPISNFEVAMDDTYQEVNDPAITVKFPLTQDSNESNTQEGGEFEYSEDGYLRYVLGVIKNDKGAYLQLKNTKHGGKWQCPGGKIDKGETAEEALKREIREELGVEAEIGKLLFINKMFTDKSLWQGEYYEVTLTGEPKIQETNKHEKIEYVSILEHENGEKILTAETEESSDQDFIAKNFDLNLLTFKNYTSGPVSILAWTTTPWTIPANMALAVGQDIDYVLVKNGEEQYIVAKSRVESVFKGKGEYRVIREFKGEEVVGMSYKPPYNYFYKNQNNDKNHKVYHADFATDTDGTGIVHTAPEFGDVDYQLGKSLGLTISEAVDNEGKYTSQIHDLAGNHYIDANKINVETMKANGTLFKNESITHRIPFCPRSGTPLMQKAQDSWFIDIQSQKEKLLAANEHINWFPEYLKYGRFAKGIESAPDWCISRTRFWGAPMPVWISENGQEKTVLADRNEIFARNTPYTQLTKLIISRHAESEANVAGVYDDSGLSPLSENGKKQAEALIEKLAHEKIDVIITSPALRAIETARPLAEKLGMEIITDERFFEINHGTMANAPASPERKAERDILYSGKDKDRKFAETGESYNDVETRIQSAIADIAEKYPGKTVFVVSHGFPVSVVGAFLNLKPLSIHTKKENAEPMSYIIDVKNKNGLNLHRPYIDDILITNEKNFEAKKILGIHGWKSSGNGKIWENLKTYCDANVPTIDSSSETHYAIWKEALDAIDFSQYDTIVAHSLGCPMILEYLIDRQVAVKRLVLIAPSGITGNPEIAYIANELTQDKKNIAPLVEEIIIVHSRDDESLGAPYSYGESLAKEIGATLVTVDGFGHQMKNGGANIVSGIAKYGAPLVRVKEVLDVWMDSGSMPYAQMHYPFENKAAMEASFPADFIAEYVGQVRAWFYVMHVLGVLVNPNNEKNPTPSFTNVITTGVINGNDGRKMSKSFGNYPDPRATIEKYGADPIRFYMLNSPLLSGGDMDFKEEGIVETIKSVMLPIWNTYSFFTTYANIDGWKAEENMKPHPVNPLDSWILSKLQILIITVQDSMEAYDISRATRAIVEYMNNLTNWYVRLSRRRFWGSEMSADKISAYETLYTVLVEISKIIAPYMPFMAEDIYRGLTGKESVHLEYSTSADENMINRELNEDMEIASKFVSLGLALRSRKNIRVRQPLQSITITKDLNEYYKYIIQNELNVKEVLFENPEKISQKIAKPDARKIGPKFGKDVQKIIVAAKNGDFQEGENGMLVVGEYTLENGEYTLEYIPKEGTEDVEGGFGLVISMNTHITEALLTEGYARDIIRQIQDMRKEMDYTVTDKIALSISNAEEILTNFSEMIASETLSNITTDIENPDISKELELEDGRIITIKIKS